MNSKINILKNNSSFISPMTTNGVTESSSLAYLKFLTFFSRETSLNYKCVEQFRNLLEENNKALEPMDYLDDNFISSCKEELINVSSAFDSSAIEDSQSVYNHK